MEQAGTKARLAATVPDAPSAPFRLDFGTIDVWNVARHERINGSLAMRVAAVALLLGALVGPTLAATEARAAGLFAAVAACRADRARVCAGVPLGGGAVRDCLADHREDLSPRCRDALFAAADPAGAPSEATTGRVLADLAYGPDAKQRLDVHLPANPRHAPVLVMIHGGAWILGDKSSDAVVDAKADHWLPKGWIFVTVGYRLLPAADPAVQAEDVARALAFVQARAGDWGGDPASVVLMGHSAGGHLAALLAADPSLVTRAGGRPWRATVALDSAVYDVPALMSARHLRLYDRAFGSDPAYWRSMSPLHRLTGRPAPLLLICSTRRDDACPQARGFAAAVERTGGRAEVFPTPQTHREINRDLGKPGPETDAVDRFLAAAMR